MVQGLYAMETKFFQHEGIVTDQHEVINWGERRRFLDMANKIRGRYAPKKIEANFEEIDREMARIPDEVLEIVGEAYISSQGKWKNLSPDTK